MTCQSPAQDQVGNLCTYPTALLTLNSQLVITGCNSYAAELMGESGCEVGALLSDLYPHLHRHIACMIRDACLSSHDTEVIQSQFSHNGIKLQVLLHTFSRDSGKEFLCMVSNSPGQAESLPHSDIEAKILNSAPILAVAIDGTGSVVFATLTIKDVLGYDTCEVLGDRWWTTSSLDGSPRFKARDEYASYARGDSPIQGSIREVEYRHKDGSPRWVLWSFAKGPNDLLVAVGQDVTSRKFERLQLEHRTTQLDALIASSPLGIVIADNRGLITSVNPAFEKIFGYTQLEVQGGSQLELIVPPNELTRSLRMSDDLEQHQASTQLGHRRTKSGNIIDVQVHAVPLVANGKALGSYYFYEDITERRKARQELEDIERRMELFFSNSLAGAFYSELQEPVSWGDSSNRDELLEHILGNERVRKANTAVLRLLEAQAMQVIGRNSVAFLGRPLLPSRELWRQLFETGRLQVEVEQVTKSGVRLWLSEEFICVYNALGQVQGFFGILRDLTDKVRASKQLVNSERQLRAVFDSCSDAMAVLDNSRNICDHNPAFAAMVQLAIPDVNNRKLDELLESAAVQEHWVTMLTQGTTHGVMQVRRADGKLREVEFFARANFLPGRHLWNCLDVTERRLLEQELQQSQKMEAIGRLAGGVAHDFNNMLTVIRGYADLLLRKLPEDDPGRRYAMGILQAADRSAMTTQQLLAFSRRRAPRGCSLNLNEVVTEMGKLVQRLIGEDVELQFELANGIHPIWADAGQIGQIVLNLAINARDAMPEGGHLLIRTADREFSGQDCINSHRLKPGSYACLEVLDTGCGMTNEVRQRIFEPFFTTKEIGKGTGLGLSTVYAIVNAAGGWIDVETQENRGTRFAIYFPICFDEACAVGATNNGAFS